jgi:predicted phage terminase large subunit-like protein
MTTSTISSTTIPTRRAREERACRVAQRNFSAFKKLLWPRYMHAPHLQLLDDALQDVVTYIETGGEDGIGHLLVTLPPRHGKSQSISRFLPAWFLGRNPDKRVILASYGADLALKHSRYTRGILRAHRYQAIFGGVISGDLQYWELDGSLALDPKNASATSWTILDHDGGMDAMGVLGAVTGMGADLLIWDDPVKNREAAESDTLRQKTWDSWTDDFYTRLEPGGAVVGVMTRWHQDDWIGRLLHHESDKWTLLNLPAVAEDNDPLGREPGQPLWPARYGLKRLDEIKFTLGPYGWSSLYQQHPTPPEGNTIKRQWLEHLVDQVPRDLYRVRYLDKAGTEGAGAYTVGVLCAYDQATGLFYIEDVIRGQWEFNQREAIIKSTAQMDRQQYGAGGVLILIEKEGGSGGKESAQRTIQGLRGFAIEADTPTGSKDTRMIPFATTASNGLVRLKRAPWNDDYVDELIAIPFGKYRDQGDCTSGAHNKLVVTAQPPPQQQAHTLYQSQTDRQQPRASRRPAKGRATPR